MRKTQIILIATTVLLSTTPALALDYSKVWIAKTGKIDKKTIRYLSMLDNECIIIQQLVPGGAGKVENESEICSYKNNKFSSDYADVTLKDGEFYDNRLFLKINFSYFRARPNEDVDCEVIFETENKTRLKCGNDEE